MKVHQYIISLALSLLAAVGVTSCQKVIDVDISSSGSKLVIEANLTDVTATQSVVISRTVPYNNTNVFPAVSGAVVNLVDGSSGKVYKLPESSTPGTYSIANFRGKALNPYTLNVNVGGKTYTASGVMPFPVNLDSLTLTTQVFGTTTIRTISVNYHDPANIINQYKYSMYVNGVQVKRVFCENDNLTDGRAVSTSLFQRDIDLKKGDRIDVDMQSIDLNMYNYWYNLSSQGGNGPQNSATPANPPSNFNDPDVLGYFSTHTIQRKTVVIP